MSEVLPISLIDIFDKMLYDILIFLHYVVSSELIPVPFASKHDILHGTVHDEMDNHSEL